MSVTRLRPGAVIELRGASRRFGPPDAECGLAGLTLCLAAGSVVGVIGTSGSGKSTLINLLAGYDGPTAGEVLVDGVALSTTRGRALDRYRRTVGVVRQHNALLPATVIDNVVTPTLGIRRIGFDRRARARELIAEVGLADDHRTLATQLSREQRVRVAIARALIWHPALLLADEPTASLDSAASRTITSLLLDMHSQLGMTLIIATHDHRIAAQCDHILSLGDGRVIDDYTLPAASTDQARLVSSGGIGPTTSTQHARRPGPREPRRS